MRSGCEGPSLPPEPSLLPRCPPPPQGPRPAAPSSPDFVDRDVCGPPCLGAPFDGGLGGADMEMVSEFGVGCSCIA